MASAYSRPAQYAKPIPTKDVELIHDVLQAKQGRYDMNMARIDEAISQVGNIDLLRPQEKDKLRVKMNNLLNSVNKNGKIDLTDNSVSQNIQSDIKGLVDDELLKHIGIARSVKTFNKRLQEFKEDNPEQFDQGNYQYAIDKSGLQEYMEGKTDNINKLNFTPYYDINENLLKGFSKWATDQGYRKDFDEKGNEIFVKQSQEGKVERASIESYFDLALKQDPKLARQVAINAHNRYRGQDSEEFKQQFLSSSKATLDKISKEVSRLETMKTNVDPSNTERLNNIENSLSQLKQKKAFYKNQANPENFNADVLKTNLYTDSLRESYVQSFEKTDELKVSYEDLGKLTVDSRKSTTTRQEGTESVLPPEANELEDMEAIELEDLDKTLSSNTNQLNKALMTYDKNFKNMSKEEREGKVSGLIESIEKDGLTIGSAYSVEVVEAAKKVVQSKNKINKINNTLNEYMTEPIKQLFNGMIEGGDLNVENLSKNLPITTSLLEKGSFDNLSKQEQKLVSSEMAKNIAENTGNDKVAKYAQRYAENQLQSAGVSKEEVKKNMDSPGFWGSLGSSISTNFKAITQPITEIASFPGIRGALAGSKKETERILQQEQKERDQINKELSESGKNLAEAFKKSISGMFLEDTDLEDIDLGDVGGDKDFDDLFGRSFEKAITQQVESDKMSLQENLPEVVTKTFDPNRDVDKKVVEDVMAVIKTKSMPEKMYPKNNTFITVFPSEKEGHFNVRYTTRDSRKRDDGVREGVTNTIAVRAEVLEQHQPNLAKSLSKKALDWEFSPKNPKPFSQKINLTLPKNKNEALLLAEKYNENYGRGFNQEQRLRLLRGDIIKSKNFYISQIDNSLEVEEAQKFIQNNLSKQYTVEYKRIGGTFQGYLKYGGEAVEEFEPVTIEEDFDFVNFNAYTLSIINDYLSDKTTKAIRNARR